MWVTPFGSIILDILKVDHSPILLTIVPGHSHHGHFLTKNLDGEEKQKYIIEPEKDKIKVSFMTLSIKKYHQLYLDSTFSLFIIYDKQTSSIIFTPFF